MIWYDMLWYDMLWCVMSWYDVILCERKFGYSHINFNFNFLYYFFPPLSSHFMLHCTDFATYNSIPFDLTWRNIIPCHVMWCHVIRFVVAAGKMPCNVTLFNNKAENVHEFGAAHRNVIAWAPHGRFLVVAGFGNLAGEMDFYDTLRLRKIGTNTAHCSVTYGWSPCSRYVLTHSTAYHATPCIRYAHTVTATALSCHLMRSHSNNVM